LEAAKGKHPFTLHGVFGNNEFWPTTEFKKKIFIMTKKNLALKNLPSFFCHPAKFN
jgi:hypothetical protein